MANHVITIELDEKTFVSLEQKSAEANKKVDDYAREIIVKSLHEKKQTTGHSLPSVALIKGGSDFTRQQSTTDAQQKTEGRNLLSPFPASNFGLSSSSTLSPEKIRRKAEIEEKMREISLLIETATESEKKEGYSMQYALLAAELDAIA